MAEMTRPNEGRQELTREATWDPWRMMREMMRFDPFRELGPWMGTERDTFSPRFDVKETRNAYVFEADLPGVNEDDVDVQLAGNRLTVTGKREMERRDDEENWYAYERSFGAFTRAFTLPEGADTDKVDAEMKNGVLRIEVPKKAEVQRRRIQLKRGGGESKKVH